MLHIAIWPYIFSSITANTSGSDEDDDDDDARDYEEIDDEGSSDDYEPIVSILISKPQGCDIMMCVLVLGEGQT